jgi:hypothetical protein
LFCNIEQITARGQEAKRGALAGTLFKFTGGDCLPEVGDWASVVQAFEVV